MPGSPPPERPKADPVDVAGVYLRSLLPVMESADANVCACIDLVPLLTDLQVLKAGQPGGPDLRRVAAALSRRAYELAVLLDGLSSGLALRERGIELAAATAVEGSPAN